MERIRIFVVVAEELNFTRAAERLHLSQPALSKQIPGLETTLRAQLFRRDRRQIELTAAGAALHAAKCDKSGNARMSRSDPSK